MLDIVNYGADPTGVSDSSAAINAAFSDGAASGQTVVGPAGEFRCASPLFIRTGLNFRAEPRCAVQRDFTGGEALLMNPMINGQRASQSDWSIIGGLWRPNAENGCGGNLIVVSGDNWSMANMELRDWYEGLALVFGGTNISLDRIDARSAIDKPGTGTFRCFGGRFGRFSNLHGEGGDDIFQFVPISNPSNPYFDQSISDMQYVNCTGKSTFARLMAVGIGGGGSAVKQTGRIERVAFVQVKGGGSGRSAIVLNEAGTSGQSVIDDVLFDGCALDGAAESGTPADSFAIRAEADTGGIGLVTLRSCTLRNIRGIGVTINGDVRRTVIDDADIVAVDHPIVACNIATLPNVGTIEIAGGTFTRTASSQDHVIVMGSASGALVDRLIVGRSPTIAGVRSDRAALRLNAVSSVVVDGLDPRRAAGATNTIAVSHATNAAGVVRDVRLGSVDVLQFGAGAMDFMALANAGLASYNWPSLPTGAQQSFNVAIPNAKVGDRVQVDAQGSTQGTELRGSVTSPDTVTLYQSNLTGATVDLPSLQHRISVWRVA